MSYLTVEAQRTHVESLDGKRISCNYSAVRNIGDRRRLEAHPQQLRGGVAGWRSCTACDGTTASPGSRVPENVRQLVLQAAEEGVSLNRLASAKLAAWPPGIPRSGCHAEADRLSAASARTEAGRCLGDAPHARRPGVVSLAAAAGTPQFRLALLAGAPAGAAGGRTP